MRLKKLTATNWMVFKDLTLEFGDVTMIVGQNRKGKTSVRDAIEFCASGTARGLKFKNTAGVLAKDGAGKPGYVELRIGDAESNAHDVLMKRSTASPGGATFNGYPVEVLRVVCDPFRVCHMKPEERQDLLRGLVPSGGMAEWIGKNGQKFREDLMEYPALKQSVESILDIAKTDIDKAVKEAVEQRRQGKRDAEKAPGTLPELPASTLEFGGKTLNLAQVSPDKVTAQIQEIKALRDKVSDRMGSGALESETYLQTELDALRGTLKEMGDYTDEEENEASEAKAKAAHDLEGANNLAAASLALIQASQDKARDAASRLKRASESFGTKGGAKCPLCGSLCPLKAEQTKKILAGLKEEVDAAEKQAKDAETQAEGLKDAATKASAALNAKTEALEVILSGRRDIKALKDKIAESKAALERCKTYEADDKERKALDERIANGITLLEKVRNFHERLLDYQRAQERVKTEAAQAEKAIEVMDALAGWLDGPAREQEAALSVNQVAFDLELQKAWGVTVAFEPTGALTLDGRPVEFCSESERLRCGVLVQVFVASKTTGWVVCDEMDMLDVQSRNAFMGWALAQKAVQVVAIATSEAKAPAALPPGMKFIKIGE